MVLAAGALPQGGRYVAGAGTIAGAANSLTVTQPGSTRGVIDWRSFSIGNGNTVTFNNGSGATLNRVTGGAPSVILGTLKATGSLYVIDPHGVLVGPSGVVTTGGRFVASTLDTSNNAFMAGGNSLSLTGGSNASVVNLGRISSSGGDVFLVARRAVVNEGTVSAPKGTAELAAGDDVLLQDASAARQVFVQTGSHGVVANLGRIEAAQISVQAADGNVYALAGRGERIRATGTATRDGHVWLVADSGRVTQGGAIVAKNADGSGGTVDTRATRLTFTAHALVDAGQWNLTTPAFTIDAAAARALRRSLNAGTSVDVNATGANHASGDIDVAASLAWQGGASLTLAAYRDVSIAQGVSLANRGAGSLSLRADASGIDNGAGVINRGTLDWSNSTGTISAFYEMTGTYVAGTQRTNAGWTPPQFSGLRTQSTAYKLVNSVADLKHVAADLAGNYALGRDIDASATSDGSYVPLGNTTTAFSGQFDGQGHRITSLTLAQAWFPPDKYAQPLMGMFGEIGASGVVRNLKLDGAIPAAPTSPFFFGPTGDLGILAAINSGTVVGVHTSGSIHGGAESMSQDYTEAGGLVGVNNGTILRSSSSVSLLTGQTLGGLVGVNNGLIVQSFSSGPVTTMSYINVGGGGLVGTNTGTIKQSYSTSPMTLVQYCRGAYNPDCGGAALVVVNYGTISQSFATGLVQNNEYEPFGIARDNNGVITNDVYWNKETTGAVVGVGFGAPLPAANGLTTAQMSNAGSFAGYDFGSTGVWAMPAGATHPVLRWEVGQ